MRYSSYYEKRVALERELWKRWKSAEMLADIVRGMGIRGTNENTNGLLRQYFPKGTDISRFSQAELNRVAKQLNQRPRKTLGYATPADTLGPLVH